MFSWWCQYPRESCDVKAAAGGRTEKWPGAEKTYDFRESRFRRKRYRTDLLHFLCGGRVCPGGRSVCRGGASMLQGAGIFVRRAFFAVMGSGGCLQVIVKSAAGRGTKEEKSSEKRR